MAHWKEDDRSDPLTQIYLEPSEEPEKDNMLGFHIVRMPLEFCSKLITSHLG